MAFREALSQTRARWRSFDQFSRLILKTTPDGGYVRLSDVGRAEFGAYTGAAHWNGSKGIGFGAIQMKNAKALETVTTTNVRATLEELSKTFPPGVSYVIPFDATRFVR